jgi:hypothetical protein
MKQFATPILHSTSPISAANKAITDAYKAADKTLGDTVAAIDAAYKAADKTITDVATAFTAKVTAAEKAIVDNKTVADTSIASAIAQWNDKRPYKATNIVIWNKTFFQALIDNEGKDPLTDKAGNWSIFNPGAASDLFANRSPSGTDVEPQGVRWWDTSFGASTPLGFISLGAGAWQYLNQITLSKIRFYCSGTANTYRSNMNSIRFYKNDGSGIPYNWFVWGAVSGVAWDRTAGSPYTGQNADAGYNSIGWFELEPSENFDGAVSISKVVANCPFLNTSKIEFRYSNGGVKTFVGPGAPNSNDVTLLTSSPSLPARYGNSIAAAQGEILTAIKLSNSQDKDPGRISGESFASAWWALYQKLAVPVTQHDFGITEQQKLTSKWAHLEGGAGYILNASDFETDFSSLITNTTPTAIAGVSFTGFDGVFMVDGSDRLQLGDPLTIPSNIGCKITVTINGPTKWVNIYMLATSPEILAPYLKSADAEEFYVKQALFDEYVTDIRTFQGQLQLFNQDSETANEAIRNQIETMRDEIAALAARIP